MATLRDYFDSEIPDISQRVDWTMRDGTGAVFPSVCARIFYNFYANAKYWAFFIPDGTDVLSYVHGILTSDKTAACSLSEIGEKDALNINIGFADYPEKVTSATMLFTKRVILYIDALLTPTIKQGIIDIAITNGFYPWIKDREYALKRSQQEKPLAFICHDAKDKDLLVRELAHEMSMLMCPVWYDEYSLNVGDSLRESIEKGLKEARKCVIIISPHFLSNNGWSKAEFNSIYTREIIEKKNIMLSVWHDVEAKKVYEYSPRLGDKFGLNSSMGIKEVARKLAHAVRLEDV